MDNNTKKEWDRGWHNGYNHRIKNYVPGNTKPFDLMKDWHIGAHGNGYAEGNLSGFYAVFEKLYPGEKDSYSHYLVKYKDGRKIATNKELFNGEVARVNKCLAYMRKWEEMPMSYLMDDLCKYLGIKHDTGAHKFCTALLMRTTEDLAFILYEMRYN